jgi:uncharacterized repeat protein (TIGR03803 family)
LKYGFHQKAGLSMRKMLLFFSTALGLATATLAPGSGQAATPTLTTLVSFFGGTGSTPQAGVIADAFGNLFGSTSAGGANAMGTVFEIRKTKNGYDTSPTILVNFDGKNGVEPSAGLLADADGNLFGTAVFGGASNNGTVFEVVKTKGRYANTPTILFSFDGAHGANPSSSLIADDDGNLFGTADTGSASGMGTIFEIVKTKGGYAPTPTILFSFDGTHGANPLGGLVADDNGNLFGTTYFGGTSNDGTVFEIPKTAKGYAKIPTVLVSFTGANGENPAAGVILDRAGNLFGTTIRGGANAYGTVFEIAKTKGGYAAAPTTLVSFNLKNGRYPSATLILDTRKNLFGTTSMGGTLDAGTVFEVVHTSSGYSGIPTTLATFNGFNGQSPRGNLLADTRGNLFSTTAIGGGNNNGIVFKLTGSGFVPLAFAGSPGAADCYGRSVLSLQHQDQDLDAMAIDLGLDRAEALQTAILKYCAPSAQ